MAIIHYNTIIAELGTQIKLITDAYSHHGFNIVANEVKAPLGAACVLYITLKGLAITLGMIKEPLNDFAKSALRIGVIYTFVMNWGMFSGYFVNFLSGVAHQIGTALMPLNPVGDAIFKRLDLTAGLQLVLKEVVWVANWTWNKGTMMSPGPYLTAFLIWLSGVAVVAIAFFEIVVATILLSILFCLAPLFIALTLFDKTKGYFDVWLGKCVSYSLVMIFVSAVVGLSLSLVHWSIPVTSAGQVIDIHLVGWVPIVFCSLLCIMATLEAAQLAKSIGGGCASGSGSAMVGGLLGYGLGMASKSKGFASVAKKGAILSSKGMLTPLKVGNYLGARALQSKTLRRTGAQIRGMISTRKGSAK